MQDKSNVFRSPLVPYLDALVQIYGSMGIEDKEGGDQLDEKADQCVLRFLHEHNVSNALESEHRVYFTEVGYMIGSFHRNGVLHGNLDDIKGIWFNGKQERWCRAIIRYGAFNTKIMDVKPANDQCADDLIPFIRNYGDLPFTYFCWGYVRALGLKGAESAELAHDLCAHLI